MNLDPNSQASRKMRNKFDYTPEMNSWMDWNGFEIANSARFQEVIIRGDTPEFTIRTRGRNRKMNGGLDEGSDSKSAYFIYRIPERSYSRWKEYIDRRQAELKK